MMRLKLPAYLFFILLLTHFSVASYADSEAIPLSDSLESNLYADIIRANGLLSTLALSPTLIDVEINKLSGKAFKLSKKEQEKIKQQVLVRFHPKTIEALILAKLENTDKQNALALLSFYQSELGVQIRSLQVNQLDPEFKTQLLDYQEKLSGQSVSSQREKLISIFDDLSYQSQWQAALIYYIQESIQLALPAQKQKNYPLSSEQTLQQQIADFNRTINMYSFKHLPSAQIIICLDALNNNKASLKAIDIAFRETLLEQRNSQFTLK